MGIGTALNIALTGLRTTQTGLEVNANNIANSGSVGYSRQVVTNSAQYIRGETIGVKSDTITREIDLYVQRQWRASVANQEYANVMADSIGRLDSLFGGSDDPNALDNVFNTFKSKMEALSNAPEDRTKRIEAVSAAETMAVRLRNLSDDIQSLRQQSETAIGDMVDKANTLLDRISKLDADMVTASTSGKTTAGLLDQRDAAIDDLAKIMDIRVQEQDSGAVAIYTNTGTLLYDDVPAVLAFDERGTVGPSSEWTEDPASRSLGTVTLSTRGSLEVDLFSEGAFRSGSIAAYKALRDDTLVKAQAQLDEFAAALAGGISNRIDSGTVPTGVNGFDVNLAGLKEGNTITLEVNSGGTAETYTFVATDGSTTLDDSYTARTDDTVHAIDISTGDINDIVSQIAAVAGSFTVSTPAADTLRIEGDPSGGANVVTGLVASVTNEGLDAGSTAFDLFLDGGASNSGFTGLIDGKDQKTGFAQRIVINRNVKADPGYMVLYDADTSVSDPARPRALLAAITETTRTFGPDTGIGSDVAPFSGTVQQFLKQVVSSQGAQAENAAAVKEGQDIVTSNLLERYDGSREVDVDTELASLIELQTAYQANARVLTAAREMLETLMNV